ncbi:hypothetical protein AB0C59_13185 [Streptomyces sp. NPDC048664]|uniref:hypothetical protein n=1 Tax=Streptomyces sp. NPDC048664 TaxID=3154505 RepID=UPI00343568AC
MPADEVTRGTDVDASRARTGPRHAAPRKPLFTRFHVPAGKAMALAAMPTAVFIGMGVNSTLARADDHPAAKSLTADEYQKCVEALQGSKDPSATPSASASTSDSPSPAASPSADKAGKDDKAGTDKAGKDGTSSDATSHDSSDSTASSGSGPDDKAAPEPSASTSSTGTPAPSSSSSPGGGGLLDGIGKAITGVLTGGSGDSTGAGSSASATPAPSASPSGSKDVAKDKAADAAKDASSTVKDAAKKAADTVGRTAKDTTDTATKAASDATKAADDAAKAAESATPSPSASSSGTPEGCPAAIDDEGGVEPIVALPDSPWRLEASSLKLVGADYKGVVKVRTANGTVKRVLKYVISNGTEIGDLHQLVDGPNGVTYHVQGAKGSKSIIDGGKTVMYTESISGNLLGLIPLTFDPDHPPPLNIPLIYFTHVKVIQAGQFGGNLHIPGMRQYSTGGN